MKPLVSIQILRAVAALAVLMFHACQWSGLDFAVGAAGVDLFFLISGFVLWLAAEREPVSPGAFLWARVRRVAPLYWLWTLIALGLAVRWPAVAPAALDWRHLLLSLAFIPHNDPSGGPWPLLPSGWTLTYEAFFYLAFAAALAGPRDRRFRILAAILTVAAVIGFAYHRWYTLLANPLLLEFLAGAGLARAWRSGWFAYGRGRAVPLGAIALGVALLAWQQVGGLRSDFWQPIIWGFPSILILMGALKLDARGLRPGPVGRGLANIGDASYSLYLCNLPVAAVMLAITPGMSAWSRVTITLGAALLTALACHALVERPLSRVLREGFRPAPADPVRA